MPGREPQAQLAYRLRQRGRHPIGAVRPELRVDMLELRQVLADHDQVHRPLVIDRQIGHDLTILRVHDTVAQGDGLTRLRRVVRVLRVRRLLLVGHQDLPMGTV